MPRKWKTHRGDEWWYEDSFVQADAGHGANILSVGAVTCPEKQLTEARLHNFLWQTQIEFEGSKILLSINKTIEPLLESMREQGTLQYSVMASGISKQARVEGISEPAKPEPIVSQEPKKWWQFW